MSESNDNIIKNYEENVGENLYTKKRIVFGCDYQPDLREGNIYGCISRIIKTIRNALVHSSDIYERSSRYIPFSESTQIVKKEIPLMRFLAERVIIATSSTYE